MPSTKPRIFGYVSESTYFKLKLAAARPNNNVSDILDKAIAHWLSEDRREDQLNALLRRLDGILREQERTRLKLAIQSEAHALFVKYFLTVIPQVPEEKRKAAKAEGEKRFGLYTEALHDIVSDATRSLVGLPEDILVSEESAFFTIEELDLLHKPAPARPQQRETGDE
jgi:hypothetical protein